MTTLVDIGKAFVTVPNVDDLEALKRDLAVVGVFTNVHYPSRLDVADLRRKTRLSLDDFAVRFGLDADALLEWERGISEPDMAAKTLLWTIARFPEAVECSIDMDRSESNIR